MSAANLSFRANMTLAEGSSANVAFMLMRDGYLVQELPFSIALKKFRIEHYATGQPKSFESDIVITDAALKSWCEYVSLRLTFLRQAIKLRFAC